MTIGRIEVNGGVRTSNEGQVGVNIDVSTAILKSILNVMGSQCKSRRMGEIESNFLAPVIKREAAFWTRCN